MPNLLINSFNNMSNIITYLDCECRKTQLIDLNRYIYTSFTGSDFNKMFRNCVFVKLTNTHEHHEDFIFNDGLNIDHTFSESPCQCGLYFFEIHDIDKWRHYRSNITYIRMVSIPNDAIVFIENNKIKANKIILGHRIKIQDMLLHVDACQCHKKLVVAI